MEAKNKNSRITIKGIKEELNKEVSYLKEWVKTMENRLNISEAKVNNLADRLSKKNNDSKDHGPDAELKFRVDLAFWADRLAFAA